MQKLSLIVGNFASFVFSIFEYHIFFQIAHQKVVLLLNTVDEQSVEGNWDFLFASDRFEYFVLLLMVVPVIVVLPHTGSNFSDRLVLPCKIFIMELIFVNGQGFLSLPPDSEFLCVVVGQLRSSGHWSHLCLHLHLYFSCFQYWLLDLL